ncbi:SigE family RNA polymerase sigma factor [Actinoplanes aureus]|uniref:SigE family RNA polymerase sigma factor n=1 Tax=Actinoplanes aureus TaxID=2792083 RepID=A0A931C3H9_9ACTN|nr:SigE family RNA polymerase sigma factor [Actinoplanes aureus]MBG0560421.1 SigE family RNA polymerase sigma factor [Actinoplanes aureus]
MRFEEFAGARLPSLLRCAVLLCGDPEEAKDVVQEALARALVKWDKIGKLEEPYAYVRRIVTNEFLSRRRRRRIRTVPLTSDQDWPAPAGPSTGEGDELWRMLAELPRQQRAVLVLRYYEGLSDQEIAETLGCRSGTVRGYASRALAALRIEITNDQTSGGAAMTTLDGLRRTLENRATTAPDRAGLVQAAQTRAARIRRRRRITKVTLAAGLALVVAVGTPVVLHQRRATPPPPAIVPDRARSGAEMTLAISPDAGAVLGAYGVSRSAQWQEVSLSTSTGEEFDATVMVYPAGSPDRKQSSHETVEETEVQGLPARYFRTEGKEELVWRTAGGDRIDVTHVSHPLPEASPEDVDTSDRTAMQKIAEAVRFEAPWKVKAPIRFGTLPDGLHFDGMSVHSTQPERINITMSLSFPDSEPNDRRQIDVNFGYGDVTRYSRLSPVPDINGHRARYGSYPEGKRNQLVVQVGSCTVEFLTSPGMTEQQIRDLVASSEIIPCEQVDAWVPPIG